MEKIVDYAMPTMQAEQCLKDVHRLFLEGKLDKAEEKASEAARWIVEIRFALKAEARKRGKT